MELNPVLVVYIGVKNLEFREITTYVNDVEANLKRQFGDNGYLWLICPNNDSVNTRIELLNPSAVHIHVDQEDADKYLQKLEEIANIFTKNLESKAKK